MKVNEMKAAPRMSGFTLLELLVVVAIIGLLAAIVLASLNSGRGKSRDAKRASALRELRTAMQLYYDTNRAYPVAAAWRGGQGNCWGMVTDDWIPGLAPNFISKLPLDPKPSNCGSVYLYGGDGKDFKIIAHNPENCEAPIMRGLKDPSRDGGTDPMIVDGANCTAWAIYSDGAAAW